MVPIVMRLSKLIYPSSVTLNTFQFKRVTVLSMFTKKSISAHIRIWIYVDCRLKLSYTKYFSV